jgi:hypothetical protein
MGGGVARTAAIVFRGSRALRALVLVLSIAMQHRLLPTRQFFDEATV